MRCWTDGITNSLDVVEQMTYLMFIHDLDEAENLRLGLPYTYPGTEKECGPL